jgi:RNA polymerase sigma-70 factor (ECF subfamily)
MARAEGPGEGEGRLLARIARAEIQAFEALYDLYSRPVYSLALAMLRDAEAAGEITQEVFLAIWRGAGDFDPSRGSARSWILALAHHKSVDVVRRQRLRTAEPLSDTMTNDADVAEEATQSVASDQVREALGTLTPEQREAIALAYYEGYTQREIAERLRIPLGTVKTRMRDGMLRLRRTLGRHVGERDR